MDTKAIEMEISSLLIEMENQPEDLHEVQAQIRTRLNEMRAFGLPLPKDLVKLEAVLGAEFSLKK